MKKNTIAIGLIIIILIIIILLTINYFKYKDVAPYNISYECTYKQLEEKDYVVNDVIYVGFDGNELKEYTMKQEFVFNNYEAYKNFDAPKPTQASFLDIVQKDDDEMKVIYYRSAYYEYNNNGAENYIKDLESKGFTCRNTADHEEIEDED